MRFGATPTEQKKGRRLAKDRLIDVSHTGCTNPVHIEIGGATRGQSWTKAQAVQIRRRH